MLFVLTSLVTSLALAQDADEDGCLDSYFDDNGACVSPDAYLAPGVTVGASSTVSPQASVGADVAVGDDVFVASRAIVEGRVDAVGDRPIGAETVIGRRTTIGADHDIGLDNTFGRSVTAGARLQTGTSLSVGYGATLGDDVTVGSTVTLGSLTMIGDYTELLDGTVMARGSTVADSTEPATVGGIVGPNVTIGSGADLHADTRIRKDSILGNNVTTLGDVRISRDGRIGDNVTLGDDVRIRTGGVVENYAQVPEGTIIHRGESFAPINTPPTAGTWAVAPLGPVEGEDDLVCTAQVAPADADVWQLLDVSIDWQRDGVDWAGATSTGTYTGDTVLGSQTAEAEAWRCRSSVSDGVESVNSEWSAVVTVDPSNVPPSPGSWGVAPNAPAAGMDALVCQAHVPPSDPDAGDSLNTTISWQRGGVDWMGTTTSDVLTNDTIPANQTGEGEVWRCRASVSDGTVSVDSAWSAGVTVGPATGELITLPGGTAMTVRNIPAGSYERGCKAGRDDQAVVTNPGHAYNCDHSLFNEAKPVGVVTLTNDFSCSETEVTQEQYTSLASSNPSVFPISVPDRPVENLSWHTAAHWTNLLTAAYNADNGTSLSSCYSCSGSGNSASCTTVGNPYSCTGFRLPTDAEWEYAARGGENFTYGGTNVVADAAWFGQSETQSTGQKPAGGNGFGMYDMSGNVHEWIHDMRAPRTSSTVTNPLGATTSNDASYRGGQYVTIPIFVNLAGTYNGEKTIRSRSIGFRVCRTSP